MIDQRRAVFLDEMGLGPVWSQRSRASLNAATAVEEESEPATEIAVVAQMPVAPQTRVVESAWNDVSIPIEKTIVAPVALKSDSTDISNSNNVETMNWAQLQSTVSGCTQCGLCKTRTQTVFGVGDQKARWLFVGEGPGRNEDAQGLPFVGPAGKLLDNMMIAMGLKRGENTYIANIVKCRPTDSSRKDRPPTSEEADACMPYLQRQIELINPTVIVALGKTAAISLLKLDPETAVGKLRGSVHRYADRPLIVTYHPAYLLRSLKDKSKVWADLCLAMQTFGGNAVD